MQFHVVQESNMEIIITDQHSKILRLNINGLIYFILFLNIRLIWYSM